MSAEKSNAMLSCLSHVSVDVLDAWRDQVRKYCIDIDRGVVSRATIVQGLLLLVDEITGEIEKRGRV